MSLNSTSPPSFIREQVRCAVCGADEARVKYRVNTSQTILSMVWIGATCYELAGQETLVQCQRCGLVYVNPRLAVVAGLAPYSVAKELAYFAKTRTLRWRAYGALWDQVPARLHRPPGWLLDIGCGDGVLMEIAQAKGASVAGVEVSAAMIAAARDRLGAAIVIVGQTSQLPSASYDVVALINVLEHLPYPRQMLQEVAQVIRPGGLGLVAHRPDA